MDRLPGESIRAWMRGKPLEVLHAEERRLIDERQALSDELLRDNKGKPANWVRVRLNRIDTISAELKILRERRR